MGRENKKETVAAFHREQIMTAAEKIFSEKGFDQTTIADISSASQYSRRTVYAYYQSKEDILHHIIAKGLSALKQDIDQALEQGDGFLEQYRMLCSAMKKYQTECPHSLENVTKANTGNLKLQQLSPPVKQILSLGTDINSRLAHFIEDGKRTGLVRQDVVPLQTVYILWSSITSFLALAQTKGAFITASCNLSEEEFLDYGFKQIINSILEVHI